MEPNQPFSQSQDAEPLALSIKSAVAYSGIGRSTLYEAIRRGEIETLKIGARRLIPREALRSWLLSHRAG